jgi:hypothetical protein
MPMRRHFPAKLVIDPGSGELPTQMPALPQELEARLSALEAGTARADFDGFSWFWMVLLGVLLPAVLLVVGWCL